MSRIAAHFEALRHRFPVEAGPLITQTQQSFEAIEMYPEPPQGRSAFFKIDGVEFLVWELYSGMDYFQIFATLYNIPLGILRLTSKPSGTIIVAGYHVDLGALAAAITRYFGAARPSGNTGRKKQKLMLFGFSENLGHHFWNEVGGLVSAIETGILETITGAIVGPYDYFNLGPLLHAKGVPAQKLQSGGAMVADEHFTLYHSQVVTDEARRLVLDNAARQESSPGPAENKRSICFQIRRLSRPWLNEEDKLCEIIAACAHEWPGTVFYIDGHATSKGAIAPPADAIAAETAFAARLAAKLGGDVDLRSLVGMNLNEKINRLRHVDLCVGPIGSGGVLTSWLLRKPTVMYGPAKMYELANRQEKIVPEGGAMALPVPPEHVKDFGDQSYDVDAEAILNLMRQSLASAPKERACA